MILQKNKIIDIKELSDYLNCSISKIRKMIYDNEIPYFKIGNKYHFHIDRINQWIYLKHNNIEIGGYDDGFITSSSKI